MVDLNVLVHYLTSLTIFTNVIITFIHAIIPYIHGIIKNAQIIYWYTSKINNFILNRELIGYIP
jgi:hypothetical protein